MKWRAPSLSAPPALESVRAKEFPKKGHAASAGEGRGGDRGPSDPTVPAPHQPSPQHLRPPPPRSPYLPRPRTR